MKQITVNDIISYKVDANFAGLNPEYTYIVDWGDGSIDTNYGLSTHYIAHQYNQAGKYNPKVTIRDNKKGCWKVLDLETIYVLGITLTTDNVYYGTLPVTPVFNMTIDGSYDIDTGNVFSVKTKWYFGDGVGTSLNHWSTITPITTQPFVSSMNSYTFTTAGQYTVWVAMQIVDTSISSLESQIEVSNLVPLTFTILGEQTQPQVFGRVISTSALESTTQFNIIIESGTGPFNIVTDWGDGSTETFSNIPLLTQQSLIHSFPVTNGATIYSPTFIITDSNNNTYTLHYTTYVTPKLSLVTKFAGTALPSGTVQATSIYAGKSPYAVYFDLSIKGSTLSDSIPKCRIKILKDDTSQAQYFPNSYSWYGPGAQTFVISDVIKDFTIELDHNLGENSYNSMLLRAYVIDSNGTVSPKINLVKYGAATNVGVIGL